MDHNARARDLVRRYEPFRIEKRLLLDSLVRLNQIDHRSVLEK
jgi:hypothetical protein